VARLFAEVFDTDVGPDQSFFHLGGDSLQATELMAAIEREFGTSLSISILLEAPTPRLLADAVFTTEEMRTGAVLMVAEAGGSGVPLICVHGLNGEAVYPRKIASGLGSLRPTYGYRALGLTRGERPPETIEQTAKLYLAALKHVQDRGPYLILGHCAGSLISLEMAQQLTAEGEQVSGLILIDPPAEPPSAPFLYESGLRLGLVREKWAKRARQVQAEFDEAGILSPAGRRATVEKAMRAAAAFYLPHAYAGETLLIHTSQRRRGLLDAQRGYPRLLPNLETREVDSRHGDIFKEHMPEVIAAIDAFLDRVAPAA
jgi:thioesterase domain-containing protein/acyl carrier protein